MFSSHLAQINYEMMAGRYPVNQEGAMDLGAMLAQMEWGNSSSFEDPDDMIAELMERFIPWVRCGETREKA